MLARLLTKAALLLAATVGPAALASDPGKDRSVRLQAGSADRIAVSPDTLPIADALRPDNIRNPRVVVITDDSSPCRKELERLRKVGGEFSAMQARGWKIGDTADNHVQLMDRSAASDLLPRLDASEFPVVACISDGEIVRSFKDGCSTPLDAWTFGWLLKGVSERPQPPIPEAIRVETTGHYPLRGNHWSVDGDTNPTKQTLVAHLRSATHVNYLKTEWNLEDWSTEELRSLHDDLHEKYGPAAPASSATAAPTGLEQFSGNRKALGKF